MKQIITHKTFVNDPDVNETFQQARSLYPELLISERPVFTKKGRWPFVKTVEEVHYTVYHHARALDGSIYMVRVQLSSTGTEDVVFPFLHGLIIGYEYAEKKRKRNRGKVARLVLLITPITAILQLYLLNAPSAQL